MADELEPNNSGAPPAESLADPAQISEREGDVSERETALPRFSLQRRITVLVMLLTVIVVGSIATVGIPLELFPRGWDPPFLGVSTSWRDAPPQEMLEKVTLPLEDEISTIPGLENLFSFTRTGRTYISISFKGSADIDVVYRELRDRIERARSRMPDEVDRIMIRKADDSSIPVMAFGIAVEPEVIDAYDLIQNEIVMPVERVDGVGDVEVQGLEPKEVLIELDRARTEAAGLDIFSIGQDLQRDNFTMASGHVETAGKKLLLRSVARYEDLDALAHRQVAPNVRLGDIAGIRYDEAEKKYRVRSNGKPAYFAIVRKESEANAIDVSKRLTEVIEGLNDNPRLSLVGVEVFFDQGSAILDSLDTLLSSGQIGALFAALVLFFFLRRFRMTLIISLAIPLSMFMGMTAMFFLGESLNILTLLGLMISVGLLVDNSVVVAENIFRLHRNGVGRREAAVRGAGEISLAIVMATLTTVVVFLPVSLVDGPGRFFLLRLSIPITASLIASLLVALIFVPLACYLTLPASTSKRQAGRRRQQAFQSALRVAYDKTFGALERAYHRILQVALRRRVDLAIVVTAVIALTAAVPMQKVEMAKTSEEDHGGIELDIVLPNSTTLDEADAYFQQAERILAEKKDEWDLGTTLVFFRRNYGEVQAWFKVPRTNEITDAEVREELSKLLPEKGGVRIYTGLEDETQEETAELYNLTLTGDDWRQLETVAKDLEEVLGRFEGVSGIKRSDDEDQEEMGISIDRERAQRLGIEPTTIAGVVRNSLGGAALPKIYRDGREIPVRVRFREEDRENLAQLMDFRVPTAAGGSVALSSVADTTRLESAGRIARTNRQTSRSITLELSDDDSQAVRRNLDRYTATIDLPEGIRFGQPRRGSSSSDEARTMGFAALLSVVFIYLLMGFLFESFILPLSIVTTIPLAILGVYWGHFFFGVDMDLLGMVGVVLLIGVVVNNGIVLVDYTNRLREAGHPRSEAMLDSAQRRFRPIMMTALTTISGMFPLLFGGEGELGLSYKSFAVTLIGGMTVATLLTLLVVPVVYTVFDDLRNLISATADRLVRRKTAPAPVTLALMLLCLLPLGVAGGARAQDDHTGHEAHDAHAGHDGHMNRPGFHHDFSDVERWAKIFDDPERVTWQKPEHVIALMHIEPGMHVADLGAGTGFFLGYLSVVVGETGRVEALDIEATLVDHMRERTAEAGWKNVESRLVATDDPAFEPGSMDRILIVDVWHHIDNRVDYTAKLRQALSPRGQVVVVDFTLDSPEGPPKEHRMPPEQVVKELEAGGLKAWVVPDEDLPRQYVVVASLPDDV